MIKLKSTYWKIRCLGCLLITNIGVRKKMKPTFRNRQCNVYLGTLSDSIPLCLVPEISELMRHPTSFFKSEKQ